MSEVNELSRMNARDKILVAARRVFASKGFKGAATRDIAKEAGAAEVTLFRQFGSKEALLLEVLTPAFKQSISRLRAESTGKSAREVLVDVCKARLECSEENTDLMSIMWSEVHINPLVREAFREAMAVSAKELSVLLGDASIDASWMVLGAVFGVVAFHNLFGQREDADNDQVAENLARMLADGVLH